MIFNDIVDTVSEVNNYKISNFQEYYDNAKKINEYYNFLTVDSIKGSALNELPTLISKLRNSMGQIIMLSKTHKAFLLGKSVTQFQTYYSNLLNNLNLNNLNYEPIIYFIKSMNDYAASMDTFLTSNEDEMPKSFVTLYESSKNFIKYYEQLDFLASELESYKTFLENTWDGIDENNTITIRFYSESISLSDITSYNISLEKMYSIICRLIDVPSDNSLLLPVKIESGSLYEKLKGHKEAISILISILTLSYNIFHDNYSHIRTLETQVEQANYIKSKLEIIKFAETNGINVTEESKQSLEQEIIVLLNNSLDLIKNNPDISINDSKISLIPNQNSQKFISDCEKLQLKESNQ